MRRIEPLGKLNTIPPSHQSTVPNGLLQESQPDSFYDLLQDAATTCRRTPSRFGGRFLARKAERPLRSRHGVYV
ncbi:hypothetical protein [Candidatus Magnetaquicoccus inordinatus]|jgi:hypothetical protein|uniref:hypothetical protein n=1 Tax=Candidatus Magnetaquicoccus inordinatus TaxID=2496818 RepID=UPI00102BF755|nr:hypothetical protein [Candidatus Magnetaquicoccus inordinatus]